MYDNVLFMIAEGIVFDIPFDMSSYKKEDILERYTPYRDTSKWTNERIQKTSENFELNLDEDIVITDDMVIKKYTPDKLSILANLYLTTGIFDVVCPKLCRVDLLDSGSLLMSYPFFPDNPEYSKKIEQTLEEIARVSLFILEEVGIENLEKWREKITRYVNIYVSYVNRKKKKKIGNKKIVKRIYKNILDDRGEDC